MARDDTRRKIGAYIVERLVRETKVRGVVPEERHARPEPLQPQTPPGRIGSVEARAA